MCLLDPLVLTQMVASTFQNSTMALLSLQYTTRCLVAHSCCLLRINTIETFLKMLHTVYKLAINSLQNVALEERFDVTVVTVAAAAVQQISYCMALETMQ